ncbi:ankyrin repeat [Fusarium heterosporum]|uniref:Ankyrin repeat n=1 Tax=Fusarium heterosporum TaxID=42747 RepID=A0A8H5WFI1_FUSHE|nr:ankyrin repeat [Fusarium heterosporum]
MVPSKRKYQSAKVEMAKHELDCYELKDVDILDLMSLSQSLEPIEGCDGPSLRNSSVLETFLLDRYFHMVPVRWDDQERFRLLNNAKAYLAKDKIVRWRYLLDCSRIAKDEEHQYRRWPTCGNPSCNNKTLTKEEPTAVQKAKTCTSTGYAPQSRASNGKAIQNGSDIWSGCGAHDHRNLESLVEHRKACRKVLNSARTKDHPPVSEYGFGRVSTQHQLPNHISASRTDSALLSEFDGSPLASEACGSVTGFDASCNAEIDGKPGGGVSTDVAQPTNNTGEGAIVASPSGSALYAQDGPPSKAQLYAEF